MRPVPVSVVHSTVKPGDSVHVYGVCTSGESAHKRVASRMVKCPHCGTAQRHMLLAGIALQQCCTESAGTSPAAWEEDVTGCLFIPVSTDSWLLYADFRRPLVVWSLEGHEEIHENLCSTSLQCAKQTNRSHVYKGK